MLITISICLFYGTILTIGINRINTKRKEEENMYKGCTRYPHNWNVFFNEDKIKKLHKRALKGHVKLSN
jgi:hypothetical protein